MSDSVKLTSGAVRRIYTIEGRPIKRFDELEDSGIYVATSGEALKKVAYQMNFSEPDFYEARSRLKTAKARAASEVRLRVRTASFFRKNVSADYKKYQLYSNLF